MTLFGCSPGPTTYQVVFFFANDFAVVGSTSRYIIVNLAYTDASGTHVIHHAQAAPPGAQLVTCHYIGPATGRNYTAVGFFTPGG